MLVFIKAILFLFSFFGLNAFVAKFVRTNPAFLPLLTTSLISTVILIAGSLNGLFWSSVALYGFGFLYAGYFLFRKKPRKIEFHMLLIIIGVLLLLIYLYIGKLMHYDNFSHWALMVKEMLKLNAFPTQENDHIIAFITYPPGSANFIYYVCRFISDGEGAMIFAQSLITFFSVIPLLALIKKQKIASYVAFAAAILIAFTINIQIHDLLVDSILATIGASLTIIIYTYRDRLKEALLLIIPIMIFVSLIKNSGIYFVVGNGALYLYYYIKRREFKIKELLLIAIGFALPFVMMYLWKLHVNASFSPEMISGAKHTMSITAYLKNWSLLDMGAITAITKKYIKALFSFEYRTMVLLYIIDAAAIVMCVFFEKKFRKAILALNLFGILYLISLWAMYLFSMPYEEAIDLASFERYLATFALYSVLILFMLLYINQMTRRVTLCVGLIAAATVFMVCDVSTLLYPSYQHVKLKDSGRDAVTAAVNDFMRDESVANGKPLAVNVQDKAYSDDYYSYYVRYLLTRTDVEIVHEDPDFKGLDQYYLIRS